MKVILDKSVLVAANDRTLREFIGNGCFVFTPTLRYEIATSEAPMIRKCKRTLCNLTGHWLADLDALVSWEIGEGQSAQEAEALWNYPRSLDGLFEVRSEDIDGYENGWAILASVSAAPEDTVAVKNIRRMQKPEFYRFLETKQATLPLAKMARKSWSDAGKERGLKVSKKFRPGPSWLCYGLELVSILALYQKFLRYGDATADKENPANFGLDFTYVAFFSIADGLLSADKNMLRLAWACWPGKRTGLFAYDMETGKIKRYSPDWMCGA